MDEAELRQLKESLSEKSRQLDEAKQSLESMKIELEANEGLVRLAMEDMRRLFGELLAAQTKLLQADKMATIGLLTAGIIHEVSNPLMYIQGSLDLMAESLENPSSGRQRPLELLAQCREGSARILSLVSDIKTFAHARTGDWKPEDLNAVLDSVLRIVRSQIRDKVAVTKEFSELPAVRGDARQLSQLFLNLIVNAVQAMGEPGGEIRLRTYAEKDRVCVEISDDGPGMSEEVRKRLFEPFFTTKDPGAGTGLGLSICADIAKKHGGEIRVESSPGQGSKFTVSLPLEA